MTRPRLSLAIPCAVAALLTLASCTSSSHHHAATAAASPTTTSTSATTSTGATSQAGLPQGVIQAPGPTDVPNDPAARKNVTMTECLRTSTGWSASGTAANSRGESTTYSITVSFTTSADTVINHAETTIAVPAKGHKTWKVSAAFVAPPGTTCVLRGVAPA